MSKKLYFLITNREKSGKMRVKALSGQTLGDSPVPINTRWNIGCNTDIREVYPAGTIFCSEDLVSADGHYKVPQFVIYPVATPDGSMATGAKKPHYTSYLDFKAGRTEFSKPDEPTVPPVVDDEELPPPSYIERISSKKSFKPPTIEDDGFYVDKDHWYFLIANIRARENTIITGDSGTGKTELIHLLAQKLGKDWEPFDMGAMKDALTGLLGTHRIVDGVSKFDYARFPMVIQKECIVQLDEINRAPNSSNNLLFPCLDFRRALPVEIAASTGARMIPVHRDCTFFATANVGNAYTGTNQLDRALLERFVPLELTYLPKDIEIKVLMHRVGVARNMADKIMGYAQDIRNLYGKDELSTAVSIRHTMKVAKMVVDGFDLTRAIEMIFYPLFEGTKSTGERAIVSGIVAKR